MRGGADPTRAAEPDRATHAHIEKDHDRGRGNSALALLPPYRRMTAQRKLQKVGQALRLHQSTQGGEPHSECWLAPPVTHAEHLRKTAFHWTSF